MQIGVNAWVWVSPCTTDELAALAPKVKQMGFDILEIPIESTFDLDYEIGAQILKTNGLQGTMSAVISADRDLIHTDGKIRENAMIYVRHCIDAAHTLGITNVVGPFYSAVGRVWQQPADERAHDLEVLVKNLKDLSAYAADHGVVLCLEPINRFETSFINLAAQAIEVVDRVDSPACKILLDTFHMNIEEKSTGAAIRLTGSRLAHIHACENDRGAPGSGHIPWDDVAQALRDIHYDGPLVIESFTNKVKSIARAAAIWRPFEASQDALAENGLRFLRQLVTG